MSSGLALTLILIVTTFTGCLILRALYEYHQIMKYREELNSAEMQEKINVFRENLVVKLLITERIGCIGHYNGKEIPSHVKLDDGRLFEYCSLAIKNSQGYFKATEPAVLHIRVDDNLLYKLVKDQV